MITKNAFTLIEMLVVIAIIAILAALIMPSLQNALAAAKTVDCMNNEKQLYLVFNHFSNDHDGILPLAEYNQSVDSDYIEELFPPQSALSGNILGITNPIATNHLWQYLTQSNRLSCPADINTPEYLRNNDWWKPTGSYTINKDKFSMCVLNGWIGLYTKRIIRITGVKNPSIKIMTMESSKDGAGRNSFSSKGYASSYAKFGYQHNNNTGFNAGFFDGHVEFKHLNHDVTYALDYQDNYFVTSEITKENWK